MTDSRPTVAGLDVEARCSAPDLTADLTVAHGHTLGVIGPNGAGKSTLLSVIAGLRRTPESTVAVGGRVLQSSSIFVEPHRRSVVLLEQKGRLFPHLSVARNIGFGPSAQGLSRSAVRERVERWMGAVGVAELADRMPTSLSGGQAQRVAIARALATEPAVLLLDEPFAALDVTVAQQMRTLLRSLLAARDGVTVLVTHELIDVVSLADQLAVLDDGRIAQIGSTTDVLAQPATPFAASLSGVNLVVGDYVSDARVAGVALTVVGAAIEELAPGARAAASFPPRAVAIYTEPPQGSPRNVWSAEVVDVLPRGDHALVRADAGGQIISAEITWEALTQMAIGAGSAVHLVMKASEVKIYGAA